jgi:hypothetical protein
MHFFLWFRSGRSLALMLHESLTLVHVVDRISEPGKLHLDWMLSTSKHWIRVLSPIASVTAHETATRFLVPLQFSVVDNNGVKISGAPAKPPRLLSTQ